MDFEDESLLTTIPFNELVWEVRFDIFFRVVSSLPHYTMFLAAFSVFQSPTLPYKYNGEGFDKLLSAKDYCVASPWRRT